MSTSDRHGGNIHALRRERGKIADRLVDFSASVNPLGLSPGARRAIRDATRDVIHYPDPDCVRLRQRIAASHGLSPGNIVVGNGTSELIHHLPEALSISHALVLGPTYSEYARAVQRCGARVTYVHAREEEDFLPPLRQALTALKSPTGKGGGRARFDAVFLCNPNSPTGRSVPADEVRRLVRLAGRRQTWVIVDEAFVDFCPQRSVISKLDGFRRLVVLRSFTKFFALPGLRVGYAIGGRGTIESIRAHLPPWSVNVLGMAAACAALDDGAHVRSSLGFVKAERADLVERLRALPGIRVYSSDANFLMIKLPARLRASRLTDWLRGHGLLIRDLSGVPGLNRRMIRVAVRTRAENGRLVGLLKRMLRRRGA